MRKEAPGVLRALAGTAVLMLCASPADAAPISYLFSSGSVTLSATVAGSPMMAPATLPLDGLQVTVDEAAPALNSFQLTLTDATLTLTTPYAGYDTVHLDFASIVAGAGALTPLPPAGNPQEYAFLVSPVDIAGQLDATGSAPPILDTPFAFSNPSASGSIFLESGPGGSTLTLDGITLGAILPAGAAAPLVIKADLRFVGATASAVPEPAGRLLLATGVALVGTSLRRRPA